MFCTYCKIPLYVYCLAPESDLVNILYNPVQMIVSLKGVFLNNPIPFYSYIACIVIRTSHFWDRPTKDLQMQIVWLALADPGQLLGGLGWPRLTLDGPCCTGWPWVALVKPGCPWRTQVGPRWSWVTLGGPDWPWLTLAGLAGLGDSGWPWLTLASPG